MSTSDNSPRRHPSEEHLSTLLSAYVDGQLDANDIARVEGHLLTCARCSSAVEEIRSVRGVLATPPIIDPSAGLLEKLSLIEQAQESHRSAVSARTRVWPTRIAAVALGLAASLVILTILGTYELQNVSGNVAQRAQNSLLNHGMRSSNFQVASNELSQAGALEPELRHFADSQKDLEIVAIQKERDRDETEVIMRVETSQVVVRERRGKLPQGDAAPGREARISGYDVRVISDAPWTAVWQRGDRVVSVAADAPHDTIALIIESIPPEPVDVGISARVLRGMHKIGEVIG